MFIPFYVSGLLNWYVSKRKDLVIIRISILMLSTYAVPELVWLDTAQEKIWH